MSNEQDKVFTPRNRPNRPDPQGRIMVTICHVSTKGQILKGYAKKTMCISDASVKETFGKFKELFVEPEDYKFI